MFLFRKVFFNIFGILVFEDFFQNDDEKEWLQWRWLRVFDLQFSIDLFCLLVFFFSRIIDVLVIMFKFINMQIMEYYFICIKLFIENKIIIKNVFGLYLIDFMLEIFKQKDIELINFKVVVGILDVSIKIYVVCVDVVYVDVYRVFGGLGKDVLFLEEVEGYVVDGSVIEMGIIKKVLKLKKKFLYRIIEQNINNFNVFEVDWKCEIDFMFQKMVVLFDECSIVGVFLFMFYCQDYRSELLFFFDVQIFFMGEFFELLELGWVEMIDLKVFLQQCVEDCQICFFLVGFQFIQWDSEIYNEFVLVLVDKFKKNDQVFDINVEVESDCGDVFDGFLGDDFDVNDEFDCIVVGDYEEFRSWKEFCQVQSCQEEMIFFGDGDVRIMCFFLFMKFGEYFYFSFWIMLMWVGLDYWCFRF